MSGDERSCGCRRCTRAEDADSGDDADRTLAEDVGRHGWAVVGVHEEGDLPGWAFTVGLWHSFGSPEAAMFGLRVENLMHWLNRLGDQVKAGPPLRADERRAGVIEGFPVALEAVDPSWHRDLFGWALWYYRGRPPPFLQVVWPDHRGAFPWEPACGQRCREDQPATWRPAAEQPAGPWSLVVGGASWSFPAPRHAEALATGRIVSGDAPVLGVVHDDEGDWWFVDDGPAEPEDFAVVHLGHVVDEHPAVVALGDLPRGWEAWREDPDGPWEREPSEPEG